MPTTVLNASEQEAFLNKLSPYIDISVTPYGQETRGVVRIDKRDPMYGGNGVVYLLQMFDTGDLVNNRIAAYMVFLNKGDEAGFHEHGARKEQEVYVVVNGEGDYLERTGKDGPIRTVPLKRGSITAVEKDGYHSMRSTSDEPLIVFVMTTYRPDAAER